MDPSQIDQILTNLCINARDAIEGIGKVTIETKNTILGATRSSQNSDFKPGE
jgi:signal transduction histidine kinase